MPNSPQDWVAYYGAALATIVGFVQLYGHWRRSQPLSVVYSAEDVVDEHRSQIVLSALRITVTNHGSADEGIVGVGVIRGRLPSRQWLPDKRLPMTLEAGRSVQIYFVADDEPLGSLKGIRSAFVQDGKGRIAKSKRFHRERVRYVRNAREMDV